jgi:hypothetical protein
MKKLTIIAVVIASFASMSYAQKSGSENVNINAKIIQGLVLGSLSNGGNLLFGNNQNIIVKGAVTASDTVINVSTDSRAVYFSVTGDAGQSITVTYPASLNLGTGVTFTPETQWTPSNTQSGGTTFSSGTAISLGGTIYNSATKYIWLGGTLSGASTAAPGNYGGQFTITVSYTGL